ncbi:hypothetical protein ACLEPN_37830 [Myxococcus sp. 1LA]
MTPSRASASVASTPAGIPERAWKKCWQDVQACITEEEDTQGLGDAQYECLRRHMLYACGALANASAEVRPEVARKWGKGWDTSAFGASTRTETMAACRKVSDLERVNEVYERLHARCAPSWAAFFRQ